MMLTQAGNDYYPIENSFALKSSQSISYIEKLRKKYVLNNRVLLIQAPQFLLNSFNVTVAKNRGYYAYPPKGLQCIAKALSGRNLEIDILLKRVNDDDTFDYHN